MTILWEIKERCRMEDAVGSVEYKEFMMTIRQALLLIVRWIEKRYM